MKTRSQAAALANTAQKASGSKKEEQGGQKAKKAPVANNRKQVAKESG